jgi:hypothetical protein
MWSRENIPLLIMSLVSAAILCFFALSSSTTFSVPRQLDGGGSEQAAIAPIWPRAGNFQQVSWNPAFPPSPPSYPPARIGCTKSNMTGIG